VIGAVLAGGKSSPLAAYPAAALAGVCERVAIVCRPDAELPELPGTERWDEPAGPWHPVSGIVHALERAGGAVLVCAADMPFVTLDACRTLLAAAGGAGGSAAVVAIAGGNLEPALGLYAPAALEVLRAAPADAPLTHTVEELDPIRVALPPALVRTVNTPEELAEAEELLEAATRRR
jgi:molybdopterin-guanine dinucleotide biosynthesis protein A